MEDQITPRKPSRLSTLPGGELRAIWDEGPGAVMQFYPKGDGVVLDYIRVRRGNHSVGAPLFANALQAAGIFQPRFVESSPIINPTLSKLIQSGASSDFAQAHRFLRIQALAFAKALGATMLCLEIVKNPHGNWIARTQLSY